MKAILFTPALCILFLMACKTPEFSLIGPKTDYILFGSGGGFTGMWENGAITLQGNIYKSTSHLSPGLDTNYQFVKKIGRKKVLKYFELADSCHFFDLKLKEKGSMTWQITIKKMEDIHTIQWSNPENPPPDCIPVYFEMLAKNITEK